MTNAIGSKSSCVLLARVLVERDPEFRVVRGFGDSEKLGSARESFSSSSCRMAVNAEYYMPVNRGNLNLMMISCSAEYLS